MSTPNVTCSSTDTNTDPKFMKNPGGTPVWVAEDTGEIVDINCPQLYIYNKAVENNLFQYIKDGSSVYINGKTYYYYVGKHPSTFIPNSFYGFLKIPKNPTKPPQANRLYQPYPIGRFLMLTNNFIEGTLNPTTTQPEPTNAPYPQITIVQKALDINNNNLYNQRFNILDTQDTLNKLTNKINNLKLKLTSLKQKPLYSASGNLTFY